MTRDAKTEALRQKALQTIRENIARHGHHIYLVQGSSYPRFAYTVGLTETLGAEIVLGGGVFYLRDDLLLLMNAIPGQLKNGKALDAVISVAGQGAFTLRKADPSWVDPLLLGAKDYYGRAVTAYQVVPDAEHWTIDVPDMSAPWSARTAPVWRFLNEEWSLPVPESSEVATGLDVLRGATATKATRWEENYWEVFSSDGQPTDEDMRLVSVAMLVGADPSLRPMLDVPVEEGLWREDRASPWKPLEH